MGETDRDERRASTRIAELKNKIQQATELIGELRETNYSLSGEVAELKRELESRPERDARDSSAEAAPKADVELSAEVKALRDQRKTIRKKVATLLERIEKLES